MLREREKLLLFNQKYWGTLRRKEWLVNGDRNSRYFHQQANTRRKKKLVCKLKDDCGMWIDNPQTIAAKFVHDYTNRFLSKGHGESVMPNPMLETEISDVDNLSLIIIPDMQEVKSALFSVDSSKTPGPNGFGARFFKQYWDVVKDGFFNCIVEFFKSGHLLR